jgi:hypothetical protein
MEHQAGTQLPGCPILTPTRQQPPELHISGTTQHHGMLTPTSLWNLFF